MYSILDIYVGGHIYVSYFNSHKRCRLVFKCSLLQRVGLLCFYSHGSLSCTRLGNGRETDKIFRDDNSGRGRGSLLSEKFNMLTKLNLSLGYISGKGEHGTVLGPA